MHGLIAELPKEGRFVAATWASAKGDSPLRQAHTISASVIGSVLSASLAFAQSSTSVTVAAPSPATGSVQIVRSAKGGSVARMDPVRVGRNTQAANAGQGMACWDPAGPQNGQHGGQAPVVLRAGRTMSADRPIVVATADIARSSLTLGTATINAGGTTPLELK